VIDSYIRSQGVGASEVAAIIGMDPRRDRFSVYASKLGLIKRDAPNQRQLRGHYFERGIAMAYADRTGRQVEWFDETVAHPDRSWQVCTPDAWVLENRRKIGGMDSKTVAWDQRHTWGEDMDTVPAHIICQCQWSCSATDLPWWDVAACFGLDDIRIYRVDRDPKIEAVLIEEVDRFWRENVLARVPPPIGGNEDAQEYLRQAFPKNREPLRSATEEEDALVRQYITAKAELDVAECKKDELANQLKLAIGDAEGIQARAGRATWRKDKDSTGPDWKAVAYELGLRFALTKALLLRYAGELNGDGDIASLCRASQSAAHDDSALQKVADSFPEWWDQTFEQITKTYEIVTRVGPRKLLVK